MSEFVLVTGLSGAGRSQAGNVLEDMGWYVIDNLPPSLIPQVAEQAQAPGSTMDHVALAIGTRTELDQLLPALRRLRAMAGRVRVLFLEASDEVLIRRYESTRRRHPLAAGQSVAETIERERAVLEPVKAQADVVVDTSDLNVHQLRDRILALFGEGSPGPGMQVSILSFGYKHGLPLDADLVIDCRFLPNPHWVDALRPHTGLDADVREYVLGFDETAVFLDRLLALLDELLPAYVREGKSYLTLAFGCTGGRHRSVTISEEVARALRQRGYAPAVVHRDVER